MGIGAAFGADALSQDLRQQILDRLNQQSQQQQYGLAQRKMALEESDAQMKAQEFQQNQQRQAAADAQKQQDDATGSATKLAGVLPKDQNVAPEAATMLQKGGLGGQLYAPPTMGDTVSGQPFNPQTANPSINLGTAAQQKDASDSAAITALAADPSTTPAMKGFLRARAALPKGENIPYQLITEPTGAPRAPVKVGPKGIYTDPQEAIGQPAYHAPKEAPTVVIQTTDENGNKVSKIVPKTAGGIL